MFLVFCCVLAANAQNVTLIPREQETRVDIEVDGKLFTSYRWDDKINRPALLPVMTSGGKFITRGFPIETRNGEAIGHPHQVGASFSYGDVNGIDFWNTSQFRSAKELERMGKIVLRKIIGMKSGNSRGELETSSAWIHPDGSTMLIEFSKFVFRAKGKQRWIDRETTLTANVDVVFGDNKEGLFAIHLNTNLQQDNQIPAKVTTASGIITDRTSTKDLTGKYLSSDDLVGEKIWGTTGKWASVSGTIDGEDLTVAVFDSPGNHGYPARMMVRPYGLLALNPFGRKAFVPSASARSFKLEEKRSITFRHRLVIFPQRVSKSAIEREFQNYINN